MVDQMHQQLQISSGFWVRLAQAKKKNIKKEIDDLLCCNNGDKCCERNIETVLSVDHLSII